MGTISKQLSTYINDYIDVSIKKRLTGITEIKQEESFIGYNPLEKIKGALFPWVLVPFNGVGIWCQLRCPNALEIEQCGDITSIVDDVKKDKKPTHEELLTVHKYYEALCKITFNIPTYDNIFELVGVNGFKVSAKRKEHEALKKQFEENKSSLTTEQKNDLEKQIDEIEELLDDLLPIDAMAFVASWALGHNVSEVRKLTKDMFLKAAVLAKAHNKAPSEYLSGRFTDYNRKEIDAYALTVLEEHLKDHEVVKQNQKKGLFNWIR